MAYKLFLVDGSGFIFRAYHALPPLSRSDGTPVGAVYGFCNMLNKLLDQIQDNRVLVVFDAGRQTFRQDIYPLYKANRPAPPEDLIPQFALIRDACVAFGVPHVELAGFEADDLIASYARKAQQTHTPVVIVSSDKDLMQLVKPGVSMYDPLKNKTIDEKEVFEKFGVYPKSVIDVQALAGDPTDHVPGVPGIGVKTAAELMTTYGTLESLLANIHLIKQPKRREALLEHQEMARISKALVTLKDDIPLPVPLSDAVIQLDPDKLDSFLKDQGFNALRTKLKAIQIKAATVQKNFACLQTCEALDQFLSRVEASGVLALDCETTSLNIQNAQLVGVSLAVRYKDDIDAVYVPLTHQSDEPQISMDDFKQRLIPLLLRTDIIKIGHNLKYDLAILKRYDIEVTAYEDTMLMSYCLDMGAHSHGLNALAALYLQHEMIAFEDVVGRGRAQKTFDQVELKQATAYAAEDAWATLALYNIFKPRLDAAPQKDVYETLEKPLIPVLMEMERCGIYVDPAFLSELGRDFGARIEVCTQQIFERVGHEFNIGSPKQLGEVLFDELSLPSGKKTKTGSYTTDADILEELALQGHDVPQMVLNWRSLSKLQSTYVEGLQREINPHTGRVHTSYNMVGTQTGRLSSSEPNLQNIPIRTEDGKKIRRAFVARSEFELVSFDYSQIELRILAHMADITALQDAFTHNQDVHKSTAATIFNVDYDDVTSDQRRKAKAVNFGIIYGISAFGLAKQLLIGRHEAQTVMDAYFKTYPGIQTYMEETKRFAAEHGYVSTLMGRRCHLPNINDKNPLVRQFSQRQAINAPIQGSNADIIKKAMIQIHTFLRPHLEDAHLLLQVHDELVFEIRSSQIDALAPQIQRMMEDVVALHVPLRVDMGRGENWGMAHG